MRRKMINEDVVEAVINLGPNLFYNSSMVSCLLVTNNDKPKEREGKVLFVQAVDEVRKEKTMSYLDNKHIEKILNAYKGFNTVPAFTEIVSNDEIVKDKNARLSVQLFVKGDAIVEEEFSEILSGWEASSDKLKSSMTELFRSLENG